MHFLYILYSEKAHTYYVGETDDMELRLEKHINHSYHGSFTSMAEDWKVVLLFECISRSQAVQLEKFIKRMKSKVFIQKIISNPEILNDIVLKNHY